MAGFVISVAQHKGGVGKSTLAAQLAIACIQEGRKTAIVDIDPQASIVAWSGQRRRLAKDLVEDVRAEACSGWRLNALLPRLCRDVDLVLVDGPSQAEGDIKTMIRVADLVLVPCQPHALDLWATKPLLSRSQDLGSKCLVVLNRVPARSKSATMIRCEIDNLGWPVARQSLGNRQAYAATMGAGLGVTEVAPSSLAGREMMALATEILELIPRIRLAA